MDPGAKDELAQMLEDLCSNRPVKIRRTGVKDSRRAAAPAAHRPTVERLGRAEGRGTETSRLQRAPVLSGQNTDSERRHSQPQSADRQPGREPRRFGATPR